MKTYRSFSTYFMLVLALFFIGCAGTSPQIVPRDSRVDKVSIRHHTGVVTRLSEPFGEAASLVGFVVRPGPVNGKVILDVYLYNSPGLSQAGLRIGWDPTSVLLENVIPGDLFGKPIIPYDLALVDTGSPIFLSELDVSGDELPGKYQLAFAYLRTDGKNTLGSGLLASLLFKVRRTGETRFIISRSDLRTSKFELVPIITRDTILVSE